MKEKDRIRHEYCIRMTSHRFSVRKKLPKKKEEESFNRVEALILSPGNMDAMSAEVNKVIWRARIENVQVNNLHVKA